MAAISDLIVIEAPGKLGQVRATIQRLALFPRPEVVPTYGLLLDLPDDRLSVDPETLRGESYEPTRPQVLEELREKAGRAQRIWVMTDADREGEVIAAQVRFVTGFREIRRVRCHSLDTGSIAEAFRQAGAPDNAGALRGIARRITDRIIGYAFSDRRLPGETGIVGRVTTGTLAHLERHEPVCAELTGHTRNGFQAHMEVSARHLDAADAVTRLLERHPEQLNHLPRQRARLRLPPPPPCTMGDALLQASRVLRLPVRHGVGLIQKAYESGRLSYGRTDSPHLGPGSRRLASELLERHGLSAAPDAEHRYPNPGPDTLEYAHEALHGDSSVDLHAHPRDQGLEDGFINLVNRRLAASMTHDAQVDTEIIDPAALNHWVRQATGIDLTAHGLSLRIMRNTWLRPGWRQLLADMDPAEGPLQLVRLPRDAILLRSMMEAGIGRPSSYAEHIHTLERRGMVDDAGRLTPTGKAALLYARRAAPFLCDPKHQGTLERVLADPKLANHGAEDLVRQAFRHYGVPDLVLGRRLRERAASTDAPCTPLTPPRPAPRAANHGETRRFSASNINQPEGIPS